MFTRGKINWTSLTRWLAHCGNYIIPDMQMLWIVWGTTSLFMLCSHTGFATLTVQSIRSYITLWVVSRSGWHENSQTLGITCIPTFLFQPNSEKSSTMPAHVASPVDAAGRKPGRCPLVQGQQLTHTSTQIPWIVTSTWLLSPKWGCAQ